MIGRRTARSVAYFLDLAPTSSLSVDDGEMNRDANPEAQARQLFSRASAMRRYAPIGFAISASSNAGPRSNRLAGTGLHFVLLNSVRGRHPRCYPWPGRPPLHNSRPRGGRTLPTLRSQPRRQRGRMPRRASRSWRPHHSRWMGSVPDARKCRGVPSSGDRATESPSGRRLRVSKSAAAESPRIRLSGRSRRGRLRDTPADKGTLTAKLTAKPLDNDGWWRTPAWHDRCL